ncbi:MAG: DDE-type integrase/transposase/recombinase [Firmicutes bacterium]|nr:DDE-type integrase/transposase/recombinase [Alicyclobacillaceae bacterium]MCL6497440.1 DDE-type integrase/transposase/recombinase [Bacillota bacterium]
MTDDERQAWALYRYRCISGLVDPAATPTDRQAWLRWLRQQPPTTPHGVPRVPSARSLRRWCQAYRHGGFEALQPRRRSDVGQRRTIPPAVWEQAVALKRAVPARSAEQVLQLLEAWAPDAGIDPAVIAGIRRATLYRHWRQAGITRRQLPPPPPRRFRRWEATAPGVLWQSDVMDGPYVPDPTPDDPHRKRKTYCLVLLDDYSRRIVAGRFAWQADGALLEQVLWEALQRWGAPQRLYADNGAIYVTERLETILARLQIRLLHSRPYRPQGKGKQERFWGHLQTSFVPELTVHPAQSLAELNTWFQAWCEEHSHRRVHRVTGETPLARWGTGGVHRPVPWEQLRVAFQQQVTRRVDKFGQIQWQGRTWLVPEGLVQVTVQLRYDPHLPERPAVWYAGQYYGEAHPVAGGTTPPVPPAPPASEIPTAGLSYLELLARRQAARQPGLRFAPDTQEEDTP